MESEIAAAQLTDGVSPSTQTEPTVAEIVTVPTEPVAAPIETPEAAPSAEVAEAEKETPKEPEAPTHGTSLLGEATTEEEKTPEEAEKPEEVVSEEKKEETEPEVAPPIEPMVYEEFKFPEGAKIEKEQLEEFTKTIGEHRLPQETAQKLMDMHVKAVENITKQVSADQWKVFHDQQKKWNTEIMADPMLGGSGHKTAMAKIAEVRDKLVPEEEREGFKQEVAMTGGGNGPYLLRALLRAHKYITNGKPLDTPIGAPPDIGAKPKTRAELMYGDTHKGL